MVELVKVGSRTLFVVIDHSGEARGQRLSGIEPITEALVVS
jgi:hypothetical protein